MLGYRRRSFDRAHELLTKLRENKDDIETLRLLQQLLVGEIIRAERSGKKIKADLSAIQSGDGASKVKRASSLKSRIEKIRHVAFVWRAFGDAIAFTYLDKFALKQTFFSIHSTNAQQSAGFLSDKSGLAVEIAAVEKAFELGVPAMLTDITNTIRHGDVCVLVGPDPQLIEVKTSKRLDRRGRRQRDELRELASFFQTDKSEKLRGIGPARRIAAESEEVAYVAEIEACITEAIEQGHAIATPEPGVHYIVFSDEPESVRDVMGRLTLKMPWLVILNELKNSRAWSPYVPFTISLRNRDHLWAFIRGEIIIIVVLDIQRLIDVGNAAGAKVRLKEDDEDYLLTVITPTGVEASVSSQFLIRGAVEFVSPEWLMKSAIENIEKGAAIVSDEIEQV